MKKINLFLSFCLVILSLQLNAQDTITNPVQYDKVTLGFGLGIDYGGIGTNLSVYPNKNLGFFAGAGFAISGLGFNAGAKVRFVPKKPTSAVCPFLMAMYGYNAVIYVPDAREFNKFFYGPTIGIGIDYPFVPEKSGYWSFGILFPIRSAEVEEYINYLEMSQNFASSGLWPFGISVGYKIKIH